MMPRLFTLSLGWLALSFVITGHAPGQSIPANYTIPDSTLSPDHNYGITVPQAAHYDDIAHPQNELVEVKTGRVLTVIKADAGWDRGNYDNVLPSRWSPDGSLLLWEVDGKWSPTALVLLKIEGGAVKWQIDLLKTAQQAILVQTKKAKPQNYRAAKKENAGNGSAYPDGFTIDVYAAGQATDPVSFPLKVHADLTSNPKGIDPFPKDAQLDSQLDGVVDANGKFSVTEFHLGNTVPTQRW